VACELFKYSDSPNFDRGKRAGPKRAWCYLKYLPPFYPNCQVPQRHTILIDGSLQFPSRPGQILLDIKVHNLYSQDLLHELQMPNNPRSPQKDGIQVNRIIQHL